MGFNVKTVPRDLTAIGAELLLNEAINFLDYTGVIPEVKVIVRNSRSSIVSGSVLKINDLSYNLKLVGPFSYECFKKHYYYLDVEKTIKRTFSVIVHECKHLVDCLNKERFVYAKYTYKYRCQEVRARRAGNEASLAAPEVCPVLAFYLRFFETEFKSEQ